MVQVTEPLLQLPKMGPEQTLRARRPIPSSRQPVLTYIDRMDAVKRQRGDIDRILLANISKKTSLERGIVGPTGASSIVNASVLGPLFAAWGLIAGYRIIHGASDARSYLRLITLEIEKLSRELQTLERDTDGAATPEVAAALASRIKVLAEFRAGVRRAASEQRFNQTVPGFIQLGASVGIMAVGINSVPTLANATPLLGSTASLALGVASGGALCVYGGLSLARSAAMALRAWSKPRRDLLAAGDARQRAYLKAYNARVGLHRLFHTLNSVSWAGFVGGCGCMIGIAAGAALSHGAVVAAVVITALAVVVWDALWGERCAPRNAMTPHIDRNHLQSVGERAELWSLLDKEGGAKKALRETILAGLPAGGRGPSLKNRYRFGWRYVPMIGGLKRLAAWAAKADDAAINAALLTYLAAHMERETEFFASKLARHSEAAGKRRREVEASDNSLAPGLAACVAYDDAITCELSARAEAASALHAELQRTQATADGAADKPVQQEHVNRLLAEFIAVNDLENEVFSGRDVERDPLSFHAHMRPATWLAKARPVQINLAPGGLKAIETSGLTGRQRGRLLHALMSDRQREYELDALFNVEADQRISV